MVRTMDNYETVREVITAYYQSTHVANYRSNDIGGPAPIDVGALQQKGGRGKMGPHSQSFSFAFWKAEEEEKCPPSVQRTRKRMTKVLELRTTWTPVKGP